VCTSLVGDIVAAQVCHGLVYLQVHHSGTQSLSQ
jgi:hypothetical protein